MPHTQQQFILFLFLLFVLGMIPISGCGSGNCTGDIPIPKVSSIFPATLDPQILPATITVSGNHFETWSVVNFNGMELTTTYLSGSGVSAIVPQEVTTWYGIHSGSTASISVTTAGSVVGSFAGNALGCSNGGTSNSVTLKFQ
jgi:hypothetical protein